LDLDAFENPFEVDFSNHTHFPLLNFKFIRQLADKFADGIVSGF